MIVKKKKIIGITLSGVVLAAILSFVGISDREFQLMKNMDIFFNLFREINLLYVDEPNPETLIQKGLEGMLDALDPYTSFIPEESKEDFKAVTDGQYGGIGITMRDMEGELTVVDVARHSPADKAGLKAGDKLMRVDDKWLTGKTDNDAFGLMRGVPHTKVKVTYLQASTKKELTKEMTREMIAIPNVPYYGMVDDAGKTGYIRLANFSIDAGKEVKEALLDLKRKHNIQSLILDVRNNPGGLLVEAVDVVN
ncbi:MAG: PDZ domain-containing protein, partial [Bacteroidales bacterium]|nr:PDZ domain-containing protein [Bacteroidales bacterium]